MGPDFEAIYRKQPREPKNKLQIKNNLASLFFTLVLKDIFGGPLKITSEK